MSSLRKEYLEAYGEIVNSQEINEETILEPTHIDRNIETDYASSKKEMLEAYYDIINENYTYDEVAEAMPKGLKNENDKINAAYAELNRMFGKRRGSNMANFDEDLIPDILRAYKALNEECAKDVKEEEKEVDKVKDKEEDKEEVIKEESEVTDEDSLTKYANAIAKEVFGDKADQKIIDDIVKNAIDKSDDDWGKAAGMVKNSF